ncbi:MAG TPA: GntR family transcriptional regulator [Candidatus Avidesulfovibrio excrementigallinarum]|nr:GntR family transcriptional regulator [Candidatus Avidesulfovibrio excrementigallinarum]
MGRTLSPQSVVSEIIKEIERRIVEGELAPGQRLVESTLAAEWGVSRASLRDAFRSLESMGYVKHEPRRGVSVSQLSPEHVRQIYQVRAVLEGLVVRLAVENSTEELLEKLKDLNAQMREAFARKDMERYAVLNEEFHQSILLAAHNQFLESVMLSIHKNVGRCMAYCKPGHVEDSNVSHRSLLQFFEEKDAERAGKARHDRILAMGELVISRLKEHLNKAQKGEKA